MISLSIIKGDITKIRTDSIVNAADYRLSGGGGVDKAIHQAAGSKKMRRACNRVRPCRTGHAVITSAFALPAKFVIHTVGPRWYGESYSQKCAQLLANCYAHSLKLADKHQCQDVTFPSISTGTYRFPLKQAANIAVSTIENADTQYVSHVSMICYDQRTYRAYCDADKSL